jgi:hypothetical protein
MRRDAPWPGGQPAPSRDVDAQWSLVAGRWSLVRQAGARAKSFLEARASRPLPLILPHLPHPRRWRWPRYGPPGHFVPIVTSPS